MKTPSKQQLEIIESQGNIVVTAKPGSGKTFTVVQKIARILENLPDHKGVIAISFTNKASDEIQERCDRMGIDIKSSFFGTIDSFYINEIIIPFSSHLTKKVIEFEVCENIEPNSKYYGLKDLGLAPSTDQEELIFQMLNEGIIFLEIDGQIAHYLLKTISEVNLYIKARYTTIIIDEYQDCGFVQDAIFQSMIALGLDGMAVGDLDQAIYGFAHRSSIYLRNLITNNAFNKFELTRNFRCHKSISEYSLAFLNNSYNYEIDSDLRMFHFLINGSERNLANFIDDKIAKIVSHFSVTSNKKIKYSDVAILVTSNKNAKMYHDSLSTPSKCFVDTPLDKSEYDYDRLFSEILSVCFSDESSAADFANSYYDEEYDRKKYKKVLHLIQRLLQVEDKINNLKNNIPVFVDLAKAILLKNDIPTINLEKVLSDQNLLDSFVPAKENEICILTIHKSKGLEFEIVFHMDLYKYILPKENISPDDYQQAENTHYVAITRAIEACYLLTSTHRTLSSSGEIKQAEESSFLSRPNLSLLRKNKRF